MNATKLFGALRARENRKAITIGCAVGTAVVVGAVSIKVLGGAAIAAKLIVSGVAAGACAMHAKQAIDAGHLDSMINSIEQEMSNSIPQ